MHVSETEVWLVVVIWIVPFALLKDKCDICFLPVIRNLCCCSPPAAVCLPCYLGLFQTLESLQAFFAGAVHRPVNDGEYAVLYVEIFSVQSSPWTEEMLCALAVLCYCCVSTSWLGLLPSKYITEVGNSKALQKKTNPQNKPVCKVACTWELQREALFHDRSFLLHRQVEDS